MRLYTIGFTKKSAEKFFTILKSNNVKLVMDIRLNNKSQLAGFAKGRDLEFILDLVGIKYIHEERFAPSEELLKGYRKGDISWVEYIDEYFRILNERDASAIIKNEYNGLLDGTCLLCSEHEPNNCHRSLLAEYIKDKVNELEIIHL